MSQVLATAVSQETVDESNPIRTLSCTRCKRLKIRCSRETPKCYHCRNAKNPCECKYPVRDRKIQWSESRLMKQETETKEIKAELRELREGMRELKRKRSSDYVPYTSPPATSTDSQEACTQAESGSVRRTTNSEPHVGEELNPEVDETFIQPHYFGEAACTTFGSRLQQYLAVGAGPSPPRRPYYYKIQRPHRLTATNCPLPKRSYAQHLIRVVIRFIGPDYHLLLRKSFLERLDAMYGRDSYDDPIWLCHLFVVFALGQLYSEPAQETETGLEVPGTAYFLKAMTLFQGLYEEPTIPYIETLLVIAFYSTALNRKNTAYAYVGLALRLSLIIGLHRKLPDNQALSARDREHRIRVWWSVYNLDRVCSFKVGLPTMLRDEDIDVPLPSMDNLTDVEMEDFHDPSHINAQLELSRITGNILNDIYRIPQPGRTNTFVQSVRRILKSLWSWRDTLPPILKFNPRVVPMYSSRSVASLHLNFGQCVITTTRPIFFHCLKSYHKSLKAGDSRVSHPLPPLIDDALAEACVHAARISSNILSQLWDNNDLAIFGFFDALSIFSSTLILMMSSTMQFKTHEGDSDAVEKSVSLLKNMRDAGNMPAHDYYEQLVQLNCDLLRAAEQMSGNPTAKSNRDQKESHQLALPLAASSPFVDVRSIASPGGGLNFEAYEYYDTITVLDHPYIQDFLAQQPSEPSAAPIVDETHNLPLGDTNGILGFSWQWDPNGQWDFNMQWDLNEQLDFNG